MISSYEYRDLIKLGIINSCHNLGNPLRTVREEIVLGEALYLAKLT